MTKTPIFDGHNDVLIRLQSPANAEGRSFFARGEEGHLDLPRAREGGLIGGIFAIFPPPPAGSPDSNLRAGATLSAEGFSVPFSGPLDPAYARSFTDTIIDLLDDLIREADGAIGLVREAADLDRLRESGVFSIVLHFEDAVAIAEDLSNLEGYYARGLRSLGLVWSRPNAFGCGVPFRFPASPDIGPGLTDAGKALVRACNRLGIMVDLAHINARGFWDAAETSDAPLVVSHTAVHALNPSTRNLTDDQIDAVGQSGGVIGVMFEPIGLRFTGDMKGDVPLTEVARHAAYVAERIGIDHVALGSDFDGAKVPQALGDAAGLPKLVQALRDHGFDPESVEKIAYRNWFRVLGETWAVRA